MKLKQQLKVIKDHYEDGIEKLKNGKIKEAEKIVLEKLGSELYDMSLDIIYNNRTYLSNLDEEIPLLVKKVKRRVNKYHSLLEKINSPSEFGQDSKINSNDNDWYRHY